MSDPLILSLDIGGTNSRGEVVDAEYNVLASARMETPACDGEATLEILEALCLELLNALAPGDRARVQAVGMGVPGIVDADLGIVRLASNLGWVNTPVAALLSERVGLPVLLHHDVSAAGLAERMLGAGQGVDNLIAVFIGTGVAATLVVDGQTVRGGLHQAGELGHVPIREDGLLCGCGQRGCLEMYASARAIGAAYAERTGREFATSYDVVQNLGIDPLADEVWADAIAALAHALLGAITLLSPERVVIGGGLAEAGDQLVKPLRKLLLEETKVAIVPEIVTTTLGPRAGIIGAAVATFARLNERAVSAN